MRDSKQQEQVFLQRVKDTLDRRAEELDAETLSALRLARHKALEVSPRRHRIWQPVGLAAVAAGIAIAVSLHLMQPTLTLTEPTLEDMALINAGDDLDLYENLDFYQWLALEQHNG